MESTLQFFKEISKIPRESGNESAIANYLCSFAKQRNLYYEKDDYNNVLIKKETGIQKPLILQAHTDMVCEKELQKQFDFEKDGIEIILENGYLKANGTTLGADNGIGVAQILSVLDSDIPCNIEAIFTSSEETSMDGAMHFDTSKLKGKMLLNLDGFEENVILIESAAFYDIVYHDSYELEEIPKKAGYRITLSGLLGGHSGADIDKKRGNSSILLAECLNEFPDIEISEFTGGTKFNVIPSSATALFTTSLNEETLHKKIQDFIKKNQSNYPTLSISYTNEVVTKVLSLENSHHWLHWILEFQHGVFSSHDHVVTTSINLGAVSLSEHLHKIGMRSSRKEEEQECLQYLETFSSSHKLTFEILGHQPGFLSNPNSSLIQNLIKAHPTDLFLDSPKVKSIHATVEAGFFQEKCPDIEIAIISPNIQNAHTPQECVEIQSIEKVDQWIFNFISILNS